MVLYPHCNPDILQPDSYCKNEPLHPNPEIDTLIRVRVNNEFIGGIGHLQKYFDKLKEDGHLDFNSKSGCLNYLYGFFYRYCYDIYHPGVETLKPMIDYINDDFRANVVALVKELFEGDDPLHVPETHVVYQLYQYVNLPEKQQNSSTCCSQ